MGVAKLAEAPKVTAMINGRGSTPSAAAVLMAMGVTSTATALLDRNSVSTVVTKYTTDKITHGPIQPHALIKWCAIHSAPRVLASAVPKDNIPKSMNMSFHSMAR